MRKISVIVPVFNCREYIIAAVESILIQTYKDYEIIVVDDGSTDNSKELLQPYIDMGLIKYFYQENKGLPGARNTAINNANGEFIALLDADDELRPDALEKCVFALKKANADWCVIDILRVEGDKREIRKSDIPQGDYKINILKEDFIRVAMFFRKEAITEAGLYDEGMLNREDWDLKIRMILANKKFAYINEPLYIYKIRKTSITKNNTKKVLLFTNKLLEKHHKKLADNGNKKVAKIYSELKWNLAREYFYKVKDIKNTLSCVGESLKYDFSLKRIFRPFFPFLKVDNKSKILVITNDFLPHRGGSRIYYYNVYKRFNKEEVEILTHKTPGFKEFDRGNSLNIHRINLDYKHIRNEKIKESLVYGKLLTITFFMHLKNNFKMIHCGEVLPGGMIALIFKKLFKIPFLVYIHGEEMTILEKTTKNEFKAVVMVLKNADKIIASCSFAQEKIKNLGIPEGQITKILPGVDERYLNSRDQEQESLLTLKRRLAIENSVIILTVARLTKRKGHEMVIKALPMIKERIPNVKYLIIGSGSEENSLKGLTKALNLGDCVKFIGELPENELISYYQLCDLFIMPNRILENGDTEGFGMVFGEANGLGKRVIGGSTGGTGDSIIDGVTGFRVDSDNLKEIAEKVVHLLTDRELNKKMSNAGLERARKEFDWQNKAEQIIQLSLQ